MPLTITPRKGSGGGGLYPTTEGGVWLLTPEGEGGMWCMQNIFMCRRRGIKLKIPWEAKPEYTTPTPPPPTPTRNKKQNCTSHDIHSHSAKHNMSKVKLVLSYNSKNLHEI